MRDIIRIAALGALASLALTGCEEFEAPPTGECGPQIPDEVIGGAAIVSPLVQPVRDDVTIRGTAQHLGDLAIRAVTVGGERAQPIDGAFNFERWELTIPFGVLLTQRRDAATGRVVLPVRAADSCGYSYEMGTLEVELAEDPAIEVSALDVSVSIPSNQSYLPAEVSAPATVQITANPEAAGSPVVLKATQGAFTGSGTDEQTLVLALSADGFTSGATTLYEGGAPGASLITATAQNLVASAPVSVIGPFAMAPAGATLSAGQSLEVSLVGDGQLAGTRACTASPAAGILVYSGDRFSGDLARGGDVIGSSFTVEVDPDLLEDESVTVSCRDVWGQTVVGVFDALAVP